MRQTVKSHLAGAAIGLASLAPLQFDEGFLHDIARPIAIAEDAGGILQEGQFKAAEQRRQVILIGWDWFGHAHKSSPVLTRRRRFY